MSPFYNILHRCIVMIFRNGHLGQTRHFASTPKNTFVFLFKEAVMAGHIFFLVHSPVLSPDRFSSSLDGAFLHFGGALKCVRREKVTWEIN